MRKAITIFSSLAILAFGNNLSAQATGVQKAEDGAKKAANLTSNGLKKSFHVTENGFKKGATTTSNGFKKGLHTTGHAVKKVL